MAEREYLSVTFQQKENAKSMGAKWDPDTKQWYIPEIIHEVNKFILLQKYKINTEPVVFIGEDRGFCGNELFVDLIPTSCWFTNVRTCIHPREWNRIRNHIYQRANYICECCGINTQQSNEQPVMQPGKQPSKQPSTQPSKQLEAHERWHYDDATQTQKLVRLVALCHDCHQATHIGLAEDRGKKARAAAIQHLQTVRQFTEEECDKHLEDAFELWRERCKINWTLDISMIQNIELLPRREAAPPFRTHAVKTFKPTQSKEGKLPPSGELPFKPT